MLHQNTIHQDCFKRDGIFQKHTATLNNMSSLEKLVNYFLKIGKGILQAIFKSIEALYIKYGLAMKRRISVFFIAIMISGLVLVGLFHFGTVLAESSIPRPSVPEFTLKLVDNSYDVPPTYGIDQYTGNNVMTQSGYHVQEKTLEVKIKNQPFTSYKDENGNSIQLYYSIRVKGHFGDSWTYPNYGYYYVEGNEQANYVSADSGSEYTIITYGLVGNNGTTRLLNLDISTGGQADFQVQAFIGYNTRTTYMTGIGEGHRDVFTGETSGWSSTQTITIDVDSVGVPEQSQVNPNETSAPNQQLGAHSTVTQSGISWIEIGLFAALGVIATLLIGVIALARKKAGQNLT
jgi:hypothetical protein